ncbi:unnamed protein product [Gulo gulo]|uniref:Uncharacterized protein n=1 Tax=Gulo gulo TaxID=48420 RepID=A0A9X9LXJ3_GULGU|nr:unnamed protein product [Gulo gulo]
MAPPRAQPPSGRTRRWRGTRACWRCWLHPWTRARGRRALRPPSMAACVGTRRWRGVRCTSSEATTCPTSRAPSAEAPA